MTAYHDEHENELGSPTQTSISELALSTRQGAAEVVARHKKLASFRLYAILAPCLELCERCERDPSERAELDRLFAEQPKGDQNRRYIERGSDIYVLVCRFVFAGTNRTNAIRYAQSLREAAKLQIRSSELEAWLRKNGGVNALYFRRPLAAKTSSARTLRLTSSIVFPRDAKFTLVLQWQQDNCFRVLERPAPANTGEKP